MINHPHEHNKKNKTMYKYNNEIPSESKNLSTLIISDKAETYNRDFLESSLGKNKTV